MLHANATGLRRRRRREREGYSNCFINIRCVIIYRCVLFVNYAKAKRGGTEWGRGEVPDLVNFVVVLCFVPIHIYMIKEYFSYIIYSNKLFVNLFGLLFNFCNFLHNKLLLVPMA